MDLEFGLLWAKSDTTGGHSTAPVPHLLVGHLLDAAEVAGQLWDHHVAHSVKQLVADGLGGTPAQARQVVQFLAGVHDLGKASPAFQIKAPQLAQQLQKATGVELCPPGSLSDAWDHTRAGGCAIKSLLDNTPWQRHVDWMRALIGGHHGIYPEKGDYRLNFPSRPAHGGPAWERWRHDILRWLLTELGIIDTAATLHDLPDWPAVPSVSTQVIVEGLVITADWIASNGAVMPGIWDVGEITRAAARSRARAAIDTLRFAPGWALPKLSNVFDARFGFTPRPVQQMAEAAVTAMSASGLVIIEAPMGEGKTEAALVAAEVLARRFGCHGVFMGLPTQATTDAMFSRVMKWLAAVQPGAPLALSHGKAVVNTEYTELEHWRAEEVGLDCGCDIYSPSQWFTGRKRLLLSPHVVGTIDNLLIAGARVRHVALHHLAFAQKVVILDEVHAVDIYMSQFLERCLNWLGASHIPVVLLSATLPDTLRKRLASAYLGHTVTVGGGYPQITTATRNGINVVSPPATASKTLHLEILDEPGLTGSDTSDADDRIAVLLDDRLCDGGCALVIRNTVARAQSLYACLKAHYPAGEVLLLHSRFTAADRAGHTATLLQALGDSSHGATRPHRMIVVATQVAEQSLDIDADLLITDLCPIDLVLQRAGRLHRHTGNDHLRPARLQAPTVIVTRVRDANTASHDPRLGLPAKPVGFIYPTALLARTAQLLYRNTELILPGDVPEMIAEVYENQKHRCDNPMWQVFLDEWDTEQSFTDQALQIQANNAVLPPPGDSVDGLNQMTQDAERILIRAGELPLEIALLQQAPNGLLRGVGTDITFQPDGTVIEDIGAAEVGRRVIGSTVRFSNKTLIGALCENMPLARWEHHPWLHNIGVLLLDETGAATLKTDRGDRQLAYSHELGLSENNT